MNNTLDLPRPSAPATALGARELRVVAVCFLMVMVDGFDTMMLAFVAPLVGRQFGLQPVQIGQLFAAGFLGAVIGAMVVGPLADRFGRRAILLASLAAVAAFTFLGAGAASAQALMGWRFAAGIGLGAAMPTVIALTAESMPASHRSAAVTWMFLGFPVGAVVGGALTAANLSHGWPAIFVGGALAALLMIPLALWMLPSQPHPAADALRAARRAGGPFASLAAQFGEGRAAAALLLWLGVFSIMLVTYFLVSWIPTVLVRAGFSPERAAGAGVLLNLGGVLGAWALSLAIRRFGLWRPVALAFAVGALLVWLLGQSGDSATVAIALVFGIGLAVFGGQLNIPALSVELFPPAVHGAGAGWTMGVGRLGSIAGPVIGGRLVGAELGWPTLFAVVALPTLLAAALFLLAGWARPRSAGRPGR